MSRTAGEPPARDAPIYVDRPQAMRRLVRSLADEPEIALDTEANSMFAYRERLCLVQIATSTVDYLVDPLADVDVGELAPVLADPGVLKVMHGAEFDVLLLKRTRPFEIAGLYDTRVAAASLGQRSPGLAAVLDEYLGIEIDKRYQRSDWGARPLSDGQRDYARGDVCHLLELAGKLRKRVREAGFPHPEEVAAECRRLEALEPAPDQTDSDAWARIKGAQHLDGLGRRTLAHLDAWRHERARERDVPPFKVLGNDAMVAIAARRPGSARALTDLVPAKVAQRIGARLLALVDEAGRRGPLAAPQDRRGRAPAERLDPRVQERLDRLRRARKTEAERRNTDPALVLPRGTMEELAALSPPPHDEEALLLTGLLESWRVRHAGAWLLRALDPRGP